MDLWSFKDRKLWRYPGVPNHIFATSSTSTCGVYALILSMARDRPRLSFCVVGFADSDFPMSVLRGSRIASTGVGTFTRVQPNVTRVTPFVRQDVGPNVANVPVAQKRTPLERELEKVDGICLQQLGQPVAEVCGRVSVVTPTTASRARFHPQLWQCFVDQSWPDKELVVVETYHDQPSAFFQHIALMESDQLTEEELSDLAVSDCKSYFYEKLFHEFLVIHWYFQQFVSHAEVSA